MGIFATLRARRRAKHAARDAFRQKYPSRAPAWPYLFRSDPDGWVVFVAFNHKNIKPMSRSWWRVSKATFAAEEIPFPAGAPYWR